jgi:hypothetical protein
MHRGGKLPSVSGVSPTVRTTATSRFPAAVEQLLLAFEELSSNALRHGRHRVRVEVIAADGFRLLDVSDAAIDQPPLPAVGRDAAYGEWGL